MADLVEWLEDQLRTDEDAIARHRAGHAGSCGDGYDSCAQHVALAAANPYRDDELGLRTIAAHRAILAEHLPTLRTVEWPHDATGTGEALCCPRCQNAEHTYWNPPIGMAGVLPEGFVAPYVLAPCRTLLLLAAIFDARDGFDPSWKVET